MTNEPPEGGFWERLQQVLEARGWDAGDLSFHLAQKGIKISPDTIRSWQGMPQEPRAPTVIAIADLLRVDPRDLLGMDKAEPTMAEIQRLRESAAAEERRDVASQDG
jgi:hypothetical protein